ncbi:MAG: hypothetical protein HY043_15785 [Verrucomicrobia bacterium]|nr:hypothetical protein [Verrucomicrobiota bacterium]
MKLNLPMLALGVALVAMPADAQNFSSGSTGADGPLNVATADLTLDVPASGIFNYTTINIAANRTLKFRRNAANTPVYLLASGDVTITGTIDVSGGAGNNVVGGLGGPGGFDGGSPGSAGVPPGSGYGPGAGGSGNGNINADGAASGAFGTVGANGLSTAKGSVYGNALLVPMVGGSGGGGTVGLPGVGGGGGGGAILIASTTRISHTGRIAAGGGANGGSAWNAGSGGGIRLVAPIMTGNGSIEANSFSGAGYGRIRIDAIDRTQMNFSFNSPSVTSVGSLMLVFPNPLPKLDIIEAAGTTIPEGSGPVQIQLPFGSSPNRVIKVQARDFNAQVPITVVLTPDHGAPSSYTAKIDNTGANNPAVVSVNVTMPVNEQTTVNVYSK